MPAVLIRGSKSTPARQPFVDANFENINSGDRGFVLPVCYHFDRDLLSLLSNNESEDEGEFASFDFPDGIGTTGNGINSHGDIVGGYIDQNGTTHGFLLSRGEEHEDENKDQNPSD